MITDTPPDKNTIVFSGLEILATFLEGPAKLIRVRAMPARHLGRVLQVCTDEGALLDLVCLENAGSEQNPAWKPVAPGWADSLSDDSHLALLNSAQQLNFSRAAAWGERQIAAKQFQAPLILKADEALAPAVEKMARLLLSSAERSGSLGNLTTKSSTGSPSTN